MSQPVYTALFPNRNKKESKHPDYVMKWSREEGTSNVVLPAGYFELAVWENKDKNGNTYLSIGITQVEPPQAKTEEQTTESPNTDDIPF